MMTQRPHGVLCNGRRRSVSVSVICVWDRMVRLLGQTGGLIPNLPGIISAIVIMHGTVTPAVCHPGFHPPTLTHSPTTWP